MACAPVLLRKCGESGESADSCAASLVPPAHKTMDFGKTDLEKMMENLTRDMDALKKREKEGKHANPNIFVETEYFEKAKM